MAHSSPNILLLQVDQLTASFLGCYGNGIAIAPHIDALARESTVFESAYCNFPLCAPSRFSMLSGQFPSRIGAYDNGAEFPSSVPTLPHYLRAAGYQTSLVGKMHFVGADQLHGFQERRTTDIYPADFGWTGDWNEVRQRHANDARSFRLAGVRNRTPQIEYDEEVAHQAVRKVHELAGQERPFFLTVSFTHPHDPYQCAESWWNLYRHEDIDMPAVSAADVGEPDPLSQRLLEQYGIADSPPNEEQVRTARHAYYGSISYVDHQIGRVLSALEDTGLERDTVIAFTSDHGDMLGERGLWYKKSFFEGSARVPLILKVPGCDARRVASAVSLVDLLPTLLELATGKTDDVLVEEISGHSLGACLRDDGKAPARPVFAEMLAEGAMTPTVMVVADGMKYVCSSGDPEMLFDLSRDPLELSNRAADPAAGERLASLRKMARDQWDLADLEERVRASQSRRLFIAGLDGAGSQWDFHADDSLRRHCLRPDRSYNDWAYEESGPR